MTNLFIDIETIPTQNQEIKDRIFQSIKPPGNIKKDESKEKWFAEHGAQAMEKEYRKTSLNGTVGEIICISWACDNGNIYNVSRDDKGSEKELLINFFDGLVKSLPSNAMLERNKDVLTSTIRWVGHYITGFDLRFIWQRCVINEVKPLVLIPYNARPWDKNVFDTKIEWAGTTPGGGFGSLDDLSRILGSIPKGDITGAKVWDAFVDKRFKEIALYCDDDVIRTRHLFNRMTFAKNPAIDAMKKKEAC